MQDQPEKQPTAQDDELAAAFEELLEDGVANTDPLGGVELESAEQQTTDSEPNEVDDEPSPQTELDESRQRILRLQAELENYRKRAQRTLDDERRFAAMPMIRDLLTVVDNLQRAIDSAQQSESSAGLLEGVEMVAGQLAGILKRHHCEEIPAAGTRFDPNMHEAIAQLPSDDHEPGDVSQVTQVGYQLHGRVIRPSQVIVAAAKPESEPQDTNSQDTN